VTGDYYAEEIRYQDRIDQKNNAAALSTPLQADLQQDVLTLQFPAEFKGREIKGSVHIYCPSDQNKDLSRNITTVDNVMKISIPEQNFGFHQLKVQWESEGVNYYFEKNININ
jgi:hypothetical protein